MLSDFSFSRGVEFQFPRVRINFIVYVCLYYLKQIIAVAGRLTFYEHFHLTMFTLNCRYNKTKEALNNE